MKPPLLFLCLLLLLVSVPALWTHFQPLKLDAPPDSWTQPEPARKANPAPTNTIIEPPKATPARANGVATGADPLLQKQAQAESMRRDVENTLAQVRQTIDEEEVKHPEQRATLEAQFAQARATLEREIASVQGPTTDWGEIAFTEGEPVQKTTVDGQIYELLPAQGSAGMIYITFNTGAPTADGNRKEPVSSTRSLPGYPMTVRIGGGEINFTPRWKNSAAAAPAATALSR